MVDWLNRLKQSHSPLGRMVLGLNLLGLLTLIIGTLILNEFRQGLISAQQESLAAQAKLTSEVIAEVATVGVPEPRLEAENASYVLARFIPEGQRVRLFDAKGRLISDSAVVSETVDIVALPTAAPADKPRALNQLTPQKKVLIAEKELREEVVDALNHSLVVNVRHNEKGKRVVSVSIALKRVKVVLGVLTLEGGNVDKIIARQRMAMMPFILVALAVTVLSSLLMHALISRPIRRLSESADQVRNSQTHAISLPEIEKRNDEIGGLARALQAMTTALHDRMTEIERFAADVSHEIKNPLTSIRSALETLPLVKDDAAKSKLLGVIKHDVLRLDRLITDISNASRLDAEMSREMPKDIDLGALAHELVDFYQQTQKEQDATLVLELEPDLPHMMGREGPLGQVIRNLVDNARSFSPENGQITLKLCRDLDVPHSLMLTVADQGPGIPEESLKTIFERFYTSRPKGTRFGRNSGLGLSIVKQIVEAHHGQVWAENLKGADNVITGAIFFVRLPFSA